MAVKLSGPDRPAPASTSAWPVASKSPNQYPGHRQAGVAYPAYPAQHPGLKTTAATAPDRADGDIRHPGQAHRADRIAGQKT